MATESFGRLLGLGTCLNALLWGFNIFLEEDVSQSLVSAIVVQHNLQLNYNFIIYIQFLFLKYDFSNHNCLSQVVFSHIIFLASSTEESFFFFSKKYNFRQKFLYSSNVFSTSNLSHRYFILLAANSTFLNFTRMLFLTC